MSIQDVYNIPEELKDIGFQKQSTINDIVDVFGGVLTGKETLIEKEKNQKKVFEILNQENCFIGKFLRDNLGSGKDVITLFKEYLLSEDFYDSRQIFENLRNFFINYFKSVDVTVYKYNESKKSLN